MNSNLWMTLHESTSHEGQSVGSWVTATWTWLLNVCVYTLGGEWNVRIQDEENLNCSAQRAEHREGGHSQVRVLKDKKPNIRQWAPTTSCCSFLFLSGKILTSIPLGMAVVIQEELQHIEADHQHTHHLKRQKQKSYSESSHLCY